PCGAEASGRRSAWTRRGKQVRWATVAGDVSWAAVYRAIVAGRGAECSRDFSGIGQCVRLPRRAAHAPTFKKAEGLCSNPTILSSPGAPPNTQGRAARKPPGPVTLARDCLRLPARLLPAQPGERRDHLDRLGGDPLAEDVLEDGAVKVLDLLH